MRRFVLSMLMLGLMIGAARAADDDPEPPARDSGKLVGDWDLVEMKLKGMAIPFPNDVKMTFTFHKNGTLSSNGMGQQKAGKWKINAKKTPKELDMIDDTMTTPMIYKLEKGKLIVAASEGKGGGARPKDFATAEATLVFERKKKK